MGPMALEPAQPAACLPLDQISGPKEEDPFPEEVSINFLIHVGAFHL